MLKPYHKKWAAERMKMGLGKRWHTHTGAADIWIRCCSEGGGGGGVGPGSVTVRLEDGALEAIWWTGLIPRVLSCLSQPEGTSMCVCVRVWDISEQDQMCFVQMTPRDGKLTENKTKKKQITGDDIVSWEKKTLHSSAAGSNSQKRN